MLVKYCGGMLRVLCRPCHSKFSGESRIFSADFSQTLDQMSQEEAVDEHEPFSKAKEREQEKSFCKPFFNRLAWKSALTGTKSQTASQISRLQSSHERFVTELVKVLDATRLEEFMKLLSSISDSKFLKTSQRTATKSRGDKYIESFLSKYAGNNYDRLMQLLEECDRSQVTYETVGGNPHFYEGLVENELRSLKNYMLLTEVVPKGRQKLPHSLSAEKEESEVDSKAAKLREEQMQSEVDDDIVLEQLAFIKKNTEKAMTEPSGEESDLIGFTFNDVKIHGRYTQKKLAEQQTINMQMAKQNQDNFQAPDETLLLEKADHVICEPDYGRNWVYAYGLPFSISLEETREFMSQIEEAYGKIESFRLFPYADIVEKSNQEVRFVLPEEFNVVENFGQNQLTPKIFSYTRGKPATKQQSSTERILKHIQTNKESHLNKSTVLFRFADCSSKLKLLTPDMRLFGWNLNREFNIRFDDASAKRSVMISELAWGSTMGEVESWINSLLEEYGYGNLRCFSSERDKILTKNYVVFTLGSFWESLKAIQILHGQQFKNQQVKVRHAFGSLCVFKNVYIENVTAQTHQNLKERLKTVKLLN